MKEEYSAIVIGATGLVGQFLVHELLADPLCKNVRVLVRRSLGFSHHKLKAYIVNFDDESYAEYVKGDVLFSCLGTTKSKAGSKQQQYKVDFTYQYNTAKHAKDNGVKYYVLVSSPYANLQSKNYYRRMKAELEWRTRELAFEQMVVLQPNGLLGKREKGRQWEDKLGRMFVRLSHYLPPLKPYKPINGKIVAKAMIKGLYLSMDKKRKYTIYTRREVDKLVLDAGN